MSSQQLTLDGAVARIDRTKLSPEERWRAFLSENPHIPGEIAATARQLRDLGVRVSINRVFEEMRERVRTVGSTYRLDNSLRAPAARYVMRLYPDLDGAFRLREQRRG
jgi:hypothetical protein